MNPQWDSQRKLAALQINYEMLSQKMHEKNRQTIIDLQHENSSMPFSQFMNYIRATKTEGILEKNLQMHPPTEEQSLDIAEKIKKKIEKIKTSTSIQELDHNLIKASQLLSLEMIPDPKLIIALQTEIHLNVIYKLDALLLHPEIPLPPAAPDDREALSHILKTAWVTDEAEFDYYMNDLICYIGNFLHTQAWRSGGRHERFSALRLRANEIRGKGLEA